MKMDCISSIRNIFILQLGLWLPLALADTHSLKYFYTAVSGDIDLPEFTAVGLLDDEEFMYFDSNIKRAIPKTDWIRDNTGTDYWDQETQTDIGQHEVFKKNIQIAVQRFMQSAGVHTLQNMYGCEWDNETGFINGFDQFGYDGQDFIALDMKHMTYVAPVPQAVITKNKWDSDRKRLEYEKQYLTKVCVEWLKKYLAYANSTLERTVSPEVSLLQRDPSSPVVCHVTGFYPRQVIISWQKNGQDLSEDVDLRETVPNGDGTFQKSSVLYMRPEDWRNNPETYSCVVQHRSLTEDIVIQLKPENVKSNLGVGDISHIPELLRAVLHGMYTVKKNLYNIW
ncbi:H-2 class I histocompatibility antigen, K-K alpha chain [Chanos chanos]|uniref:H-2 class I histocompatibility antigen, K-K alpha chain n=1 Tax=Chanos chanos TaxID=29144 RepID=A0A6J2W802_CHACN|nr:H-2 class I histocompatibility antigen, K-K alpha chain-like [Chanos chanos]